MALSGTLETFSLPDVLRLLSSTKKTGLLTLEGDRGIGRVWIDDGDIVAADSDGAPGRIDGVVFDLLRCTEGSFEFDAGAASADGEEQRRGVDDALEAAESLLEEWREIETVVPSLDVWVRLVPEIDDEATIDPTQWRVLSRVGTGVTGRRIAGELELGELDVCRDLKELIDRGLVEIGDEVPSVERPSSGDSARSNLPAFQPPAFAAATIGSPHWTPPEALGPDAVTEDPWRAEDRSDSEDRWDSDDAVDETESEVTDAVVDVEHSVEHEAGLEPEVGGPEASVEADLVPVTDPVVHEESRVDESPVDESRVEESPVEEFPVEDFPADESPAAEAEEAPDDFLTQLAHLSPKAAAAIEATASDGSQATEDDAGEPGDGSAEESAVDQTDEDLSQNLLLRFLSSAKQ